MSLLTDTITEINTLIVQNGNEEITADVLRPILLKMLDADKEQRDLLNNDIEANALAISNINEIKKFTGEADPNTTPPIGFSVLDFYIRTLSGTVTNTYQYNGINWIEII